MSKLVTKKFSGYKIPPHGRKAPW